MGVHGLWELLSPVGRRVSVETLTGKKLAIDASIWMVQFMKAMRDDKGEMVRNAHLIGFFRRICKLLFLRTKPVFVFDGDTPALKRRTILARRRHKDNAQAKIRKTAEKLLLNHLKTMRLQELANDLESQRKKNNAKGKKVVVDEVEMTQTNVGGTNPVPSSSNQEELDAMLAASLAAEEEDRDFAIDASTTSFAAEKGGNISGNASTSGAGPSVDEENGYEDEYEDDDEDGEMILPAIDGKIDAAVLASLPPSMQLDLLGQMRERLMAENRQKYQKVKTAPAKFSELQIQSYLKTVAFRREINQVQKIAAGKGTGGVQPSRIASEADREFIFSSSFDGDKEVLASAGVEGHNQKFPHKQQPSEISSVLESVSSTSKSNPGAGSVEDVETYQDERGRFRFSRVRAMGIHMTRDLQRNLDMLKEIEKDRIQTDNIVSNLQKNTATNDIQFRDTSVQPTDGSFHSVDPTDESTSRNENLMEISFEDNDGEKCLDGDDDIFARLVTGDTMVVPTADNSSSKKHSSSSDSDCDWEGGGVDDVRIDSFTSEVKKGEISLHGEDGDDESDVEWEVEDSDNTKCASLSPAQAMKTASKGVVEEEADFQEALRRSLKDSSGNAYDDALFEDKKLQPADEMVIEITGAGSFHRENENTDPNGLVENVIDIDNFCYEDVSSVRKLEGEIIPEKMNTDAVSVHLAASRKVDPDINELLLEKSNKRCLASDFESLDKEKCEERMLLGESNHKAVVSPVEQVGVSLVVGQLSDTSKTGNKASISSNNFSEDIPRISDMVSSGESRSIIADAQHDIFEAVPNGRLTKSADQQGAYVNESIDNHDNVQKLPDTLGLDYTFDHRGDGAEKFSFKDDTTHPVQVTKAGLDEEIQNLSQERKQLGDQQRKLERNAESVTSEMFEECQELLQMFGLPYIVAPTEAEAQCAYMELGGLVDGVVTDDSDAFLFGAKSVFKNIFDDRKYVETYFMKDVENELGFSREKLIRMALLLGSDYTEGVSGIGIVNATEVVNAFPEEDGFRKFREWVESPDPTILGQVGSRKRRSKVSNSDANCSNTDGEGVSVRDEAVTQSTDDIDDTKRLFMEKHRKVSKNWHIPSTFPNDEVISAYASPKVDKSTEPFSWGKPDHYFLRKLCWEKFGWTSQKADELLIPVLKEYNKHETQLRLEAFYTFNEKFAKICSKRMENAVKGIRKNVSSDMMDGSVQETIKSKKKRKVTPDKSEKDLSEKDKSESKEESNAARRSSKKQPSKRKHAETVSSEAKNQESVQSRGRKISSQMLDARGSRGSERGRAVRRGSSKKTPELDSAESSDDGSNRDYDLEVQVERAEGTHGVRKSTRTRKAVKYTLDELEVDEPGKEDQHEMKFNNIEATRDQSSEDRCITRDDDPADPMVESQKKFEDPSFLDRPNEDYLDMGDGFCINEADRELSKGDLSSGQKGDSSFEEEVPKEYLKVGGGFCLEEDETDREPDKCALDDSQGGSENNKNEKVTGADSSVVDRSPSQSTTGDAFQWAPAISLSAMPALKRKRRKS